VRLLLDGIPVPASVTVERVAHSATDLSVRVEVEDNAGNLGTIEWAFQVRGSLLDSPVMLVVGVVGLFLVVIAVFVARQRRPEPALPAPPPPP